jgi:hypothetical protein
MIIVLDTNVVLQALNQRHPTAVILHAWYSGHFVWALSTDILMEYQEVIVRQSGFARWQALGRLLDLAVVHGHNTQRVSPAFFSAPSPQTGTTTSSPTAQSLPMRTSSSPVTNILTF